MVACTTEEEVPVEVKKIVEVEKIATETVEREVTVVATSTVVPPLSANSVLRIGNSGEVQFLDIAKSQSGTDIIFSEVVYSRLLQLLMSLLQQ